MGTVTGVAPLWGSNPSGGPYGWATTLGSYGFNGGGNDPGGPNPGTAVVSGCKVQLSASASSVSTAIDAWLTRAFNQQVGCVFVG
jgi:hypothetical protein